MGRLRTLPSNRQADIQAHAPPADVSRVGLGGAALPIPVIAFKPAICGAGGQTCGTRKSSHWAWLSVSLPGWSCIASYLARPAEASAMGRKRKCASAPRQFYSRFADLAMTALVSVGFYSQVTDIPQSAAIF